MIRPKEPPLISGTQFVAIVVLTIAIFLIIDFGRRTTTGYYIAQAEEHLKAEIEVELTLQAQLKERRDYVLSPEYVEKWAREQAHMVRHGDQPLILITPPAPQAQADAPQQPDTPAVAAQVPNWYHWWQLFFDTEPGTMPGE